MASTIPFHAPEIASAKSLPLGVREHVITPAQVAANLAADAVRTARGQVPSQAQFAESCGVAQQKASCWENADACAAPNLAHLFRAARRWPKVVIAIAKALLTYAEECEREQARGPVSRVMATSRAIACAGKFVADAGDALADGIVDDDELARLERDLCAVVDAGRVIGEMRR